VSLADTGSLEILPLDVTDPASVAGLADTLEGRTDQMTAFSMIGSPRSMRS